MCKVHMSKLAYRVVCCFEVWFQMNNMVSVVISVYSNVLFIIRLLQSTQIFNSCCSILNLHFLNCHSSGFQESHTNHEWKKTLGRPRRRWEDNTKIELGCDAW